MRDPDPSPSTLAEAGYSVALVANVLPKTWRLTKPDGRHAFSHTEEALWRVAREDWRRGKLG